MTIINNGLVADETVLSITNPITYIPHPDKAGPIAGAQIYFGLVGTDPRIESNQKIVYALQEDRAAVSVDQPVVCSSGGVPQLFGSSATLAVSGSYSMMVLDNNGEQHYYFPRVEQANNQGYNGIIAEESQEIFGSDTVVFKEIEATTASFYLSSSSSGTAFTGSYLQKDVDYTVISSTTIELTASLPSGYVVVGRQMDPTGQIIPVTSGSSSLFVFPLILDARTSDLQIGDAVTINGGTVIGDGLGGARYITVAGGTGTNDLINFIDLFNGNQLQLITNTNRFAVYAEKTNEPTIVGTAISVNMGVGNVHKITLTDNATSIIFSNVNQLHNTTITCTLKVYQDEFIGGHVINWPTNINWSGGVVPTVTATAGAYDRFVFITDDAGVTWDGMVSGQDFK